MTMYAIRYSWNKQTITWFTTTNKQLAARKLRELRRTQRHLKPWLAVR